MDEPIAAAAKRGPARWAGSFTRVRGAIVAVAGVGAVLSGIVGYYTTWRTVVTPATVSGVPSARPLPDLQSDPSIAVLPLVNLSADRDQEYFSDGLTEDLQDLLAKVPRLRVIARTSSFSFKGSKEPAEAIARKLNVAALLEGSVRRSGDMLRIKVQMIRAADSSQLWSETFDRPVGEVFRIQDEIAAAVVERMKGAMAEAAPRSQPVDVAAYQLVLQATALTRQNTPEGRVRAIALLREALRIDPRESRARAGLADVYIVQANTAELPLARGYELARQMAQQQLALNPADPLAHAVLARVATDFDGDLPLAARELQRALDTDRSTAVLLHAGNLLMALGRLDEAAALAEAMRARDPANVNAHASLFLVLSLKGDWDAALAAGDTALALGPGGSRVHYVMGAVLLGKGDAAGASAQMQAETSPSWRWNGLALALHATGDRKGAEEALANLIRGYQADSAYNIAEVYAFRGEPGPSFAWLDRAVKQKDSGLVAVNTSPLLRPLHADKRWLPFLRSIGRAPEQLAAIPFKVEWAR